MKDVSKLLIDLYRNNLQTLARLKALESYVLDAVPASKKAAVGKLLGEQTNRIFQYLLEQDENRNPSFAALVDNRGPDQLTGLDTTLPLA